MASSSGRASEEEHTEEEVPVDPQEPPFGPPPPQNLFSLRLSQALVDAMAPNIIHQGASLTRIQGRIIECVGITAVSRPMTPNEFLDRDVLHCADNPSVSELEDPRGDHQRGWYADGGRDRARRASAEWLERRAEIEAMMATPSGDTLPAVPRRGELAAPTRNAELNGYERTSSLVGRRHIDNMIFASV
ncbi:hypothetical protein AK812_SmicGene38400 [Symbiodinium microadriaticum]|uniref:Uncharacterized protein n=1 Tax=Symbiodinium microadriaticum TaxID=2951 RepID=A0A1Q9CDU8_SYMMI|nr:hypothetical protein AK812_SmicGene38400 [Symbiodinium microadriaticum]